jgi:hypothetical protein
MNLMDDLNLFAIVVAAIASFLLGGLWYSPVLFGKIWMKEVGYDESQQGHPGKVFGFALLFSLIAAWTLARVAIDWFGADFSLSQALHVALMGGVGFVAASFGVNYQFAQRSFKLWAIDAGYHVAQFCAFAVVLGLWK